jgi:UDP-glucose 4-epimerase
MRVVVTGGAGFLGAHVVRALLAGGHEPWVVDRLDHGVSPLFPDRTPLIAEDVRTYRRWFSRIGSAGAVLHLAAQASVPEGEREPVSHLEDNVAGTAAALGLAAELGAGEFRLASSAAVYGNPGSPAPLTEDTPLQPVSVYGISKWTSELVVRHFVDTTPLHAVVLRPANIYGPGQSGGGEGGVVARFTEALATGRPLTRYGDGEQTRDFVYVEDTARAFVHRLGEATGFVVYQVGTGEATAVNRLGALLAQAAHRPLTWDNQPERPGDIRHSVFSTARAEAWGFRATVSLPDGLQKTWESFRA